MTQHIGVEEIDETGGLVRRSGVNFAAVYEALAQQDGWKERFPWLSTIDEYGDTVFNSSQLLSHIYTEIDQLRTTIQDQAALKEIDALEDFIGDRKELTHKRIYIKFVGD